MIFVIQTLYGASKQYGEIILRCYADGLRNPFYQIFGISIIIYYRMFSVYCISVSAYGSYAEFLRSDHTIYKERNVLISSVWREHQIVVYQKTSFEYVTCKIIVLLIISVFQYWSFWGFSAFLSEIIRFNSLPSYLQFAQTAAY